MPTRPGRNDPCPCGSALSKHANHMEGVPGSEVKDELIAIAARREELQRAARYHQRTQADLRFPQLPG